MKDSGIREKVRGVNLFHLSGEVRGFSLFEILVVLVVFSVATVLATQAIFNTLRNSRKAEETAKVRANLEYAAAIIERHIRGAEKIECAVGCMTSNCVVFTDLNSGKGRFECLPDETGVNYMASISATNDTNVRLTSGDVNLDCTKTSFSCTVPPDIPSVDVVLNGSSINTLGAEGVNVNVQTKIILRNQ